MNKRIVIFGAGHMGTAIILGLKEKGGFNLKIVDSGESRREFLGKHYGIEVVPTFNEIEDGDIIVLAMPPQAFPSFAKTIDLGARKNCPVISVMAGVKISNIVKMLGASEVIRCIPNTPSEVFQGMTVFCAALETKPETLQVAEKILQSFGKSVRVTSEDLIDHATALCGGGPAFVAFFASAMHDFAVQSGFNPSDSALMVSQVLRGTADLLVATGKPALQICNEVMTPQGTTERGIFHFKEKNLGEIVKTGLEKSAARSKELGQLIYA